MTEVEKMQREIKKLVSQNEALKLELAAARQPAAQEPAAAGAEDRTDWIKHGAITEMADAAFAVHGTAPSEAQMDRLHKSAERLLDLRAPLSALTPAAPKTSDAGVGVREALKEIAQAANDLLNTLPGHWHDDATIRLTDAAADAWKTLKAAEQEDLYEPPAPAGVNDTGVREAAQVVHDTFARDIAQGYKTKDKDFAVSILGAALADQPPKAETPAGARGSEAEAEHLMRGEDYGGRIALLLNLGAILSAVTGIKEAVNARRKARDIIKIFDAALSTAQAALPGDEVNELREALAAIKATGLRIRLSAPNPEQDWKNAVVRMEREAEQVLAAAPAADGGRQVSEAPRSAEEIQTFTGLKFCPMKPNLEAINIEDIAHALSLQTRFGGHCLYFYSVAEHCVLMALSVPKEDRLWALLHDASEAYLTDIVRPVKRYIQGYALAEERLMSAVEKRFGLLGDVPASVKEADCRILIDERAQNMHPTGEEWHYGGATEPLGVTLRFWTPEEAERAFLALYAEITGQPVTFPALQPCRLRCPVAREDGDGTPCLDCPERDKPQVGDLDGMIPHADPARRGFEPK